MNDLTTTTTNGSLDERVVDALVTRGDLSGLGPRDRARLYLAVCAKLGLNPHAQPFAFLRLNGKEVMYATRGATDQLAAIHNVTRSLDEPPKVIDVAGTKLVYCVARATLPSGRSETSTATVPLVDPANVLMKAETKAKRRATLSILGLAYLDEVELETIPARAQEPVAGVDLSRAESHDRVSAWWENEVSSCSTKRDLVETWCGAETGIAGHHPDVREAMWQMLVARGSALGFWRDAPSVAAALKADIEAHKRHADDPAPTVLTAYEKAEAILSAARSPEVLAAAWRVMLREAWPHLTAYEREAIVAVKDRRKGELAVRAEALTAVADVEAEAERAAIAAETAGGEVAGE